MVADRVPERLREVVRKAVPWWRRAPSFDRPFPPVRQNRIRTLEKGAYFFDALHAAIEAARSSVDVEMYLWEDDDLGLRFVDALAAAAARGVRVRVLVDGYGSREVLGEPLDRVRGAAGDVRVFNPIRLPLPRQWLHRTHRKLLVVDAEVAFCGGAGFSRHFTLGKGRENPWHDRMFEIRGPVIEQLLIEYEANLCCWPRDERARTEPPGGRRRPDRDGDAVLQVLRGWPQARDFPITALQAVRTAEERIWIGTPYFVPRRALRAALRRAARRGVDVRLVLPSGRFAHPLLRYGASRHYGSVLRAGARVFEFRPGFYHAKLMVKDRDMALVGSSNLDNWSWRRNAELDVVARDEGSVGIVADCFLGDQEQSDELTLRSHGARGSVHRTLERIVGMVDDWL